MGPAQREHDDFDDLLPHSDEESDELDLAASELSGVADADDLLTSDIDDQGAEPSLDVETGVEGGLDASTLVDADDELSAREDARSDSIMDDGFEGGAGIDDSGAEDGWTKDSEGDADLYQSEFDEDEDGAHRDDGGLEGVESPRDKEDTLHDGLDDTALPPLDRDEDDDTLIDEIERELIRDLAQSI